MDPMDYFFMEEFLFPEEGGVTGMCAVRCPHCHALLEVEVDPGNSAAPYQCERCKGQFAVDWVNPTAQEEDE